MNCTIGLGEKLKFVKWIILIIVVVVVARLDDDKCVY